MEITLLQYMAFRGYFVQGMSYAEISRTLGCSRQNAHVLVGAARARIVQAYQDGAIDIRLLSEGLLRPSPHSSVTRNVGRSESRQDELLDALERHMAQRSKELADIAECMSGNFVLPAHMQRNHWDQWEMRYLNEADRMSIPSSLFNPKAKRTPAYYCASDPATCGITSPCCGCRGR